MQYKPLRQQVMQQCFHTGPLRLFARALRSHHIGQHLSLSGLLIAAILLLPQQSQLRPIHFYKALGFNGCQRRTRTFYINILFIFIRCITASGQYQRRIAAILMGHCHKFIDSIHFMISLSICIHIVFIIYEANIKVNLGNSHSRNNSPHRNGMG